MFELSVCTELVYPELPFEQRFSKVAEQGFRCEFWRWQERDLKAITADPKVIINGIMGYVGGSMVHPDGIAEFLAGAKATLPVAHDLNCKNLFLATGKLTFEGKVAHPVAQHPATMWISLYKVLCQLAELAEKHNVVYHLEHLNRKIEHIGFPLPYVEDGARLLDEVRSDRIKLLMDIYHIQVQEGNLCHLIRQYKDRIGYVHVSDVPGRHEPGTGEINYPKIVEVLHEIDYQGPVALEAFPEHTSDAALKSFKEMFS